MYKYILKFQYDGTSFKGYGTQPHKNTIQDNVEQVLTKINSNNFVKTFATSRTDARVHANVSFLQFKLKKKFEIDDLKFKINILLNDAIRVLKVIEDFDDEINVRYDVVSKTYQYVIMQEKLPFKLNYAAFESETLSIEKMIEGSKYLIGKHDFTSFCNKRTDVINKVRCINSIEIIPVNEDGVNYIKFYVNADGFLYNMVRLIVGTLIIVGKNKYEPIEIKKILLKKERTDKCILAQPQGLYLHNIFYKEEINEKLNK